MEVADRDTAMRDSLRKRLILQEPEALTDPELVALVLGSAPDPLSLADRALALAGSLEQLARADVEDLCGLPGVGPGRACQLVAAFELGRRAAAPRPAGARPITQATEVADWFRSRLQDRERECIHALLLDSKNRPLTCLRITEGSWTSCPVDPKVILSACLRHRAPAFILVHNHPSGDPRPSREDLDLTDRMARAARVVGLRMLDHLIVGREGICSLADTGLLVP